MPTCIGGVAGPYFASWAHPLVRQQRGYQTRINAILRA